jgi:hypothetical protein
MSFITSPGVIVPPLTAGGVAYGTGNQAKVTSAGTNGQVLTSAGSGLPSWTTISVGNHSVTVNTGNGHGSTNTKIRRFTTTVASSGSSITYADSAANGATFTINTEGTYAVVYTDYNQSAVTNYGISLNSSQLTTAVGSITVATRMAWIYTASAYTPASAVAIIYCAVNDVIRPHTSGTPDGADALVYFKISRIA